MSSYTFCFVCQSGVLEIQSLLLIHSLRKQVSSDYEIIVAHPTEYGELRTWVKRQLDTLDVRVIEVRNPIDKSYPIGNKLACVYEASQIASKEYLVFLDTDILCLRDFTGVDDMGAGIEVGVRVAGKAHLGEGIENWQPLYDAFKLTLPAERVFCSRSRQNSLPYFNAGFVCMKANSILAESWIDTAQSLHQNKVVSSIRFLDQLALPIAMARYNLQYQCVADKYNSLLLNVDNSIFFHYHNFFILKEKFSGFSEFFNEIFSACPELEKDFEIYHDFYEKRDFLLKNKAKTNDI